MQIMENQPNGGIRKYQNTTIFVYPDTDRVAELKDRAAWLVAIGNAKNDERVKTTKGFLSKINEKYSEGKVMLRRICFMTYCKLVYPNGSSPAITEIRYMSTKAETIAEAVIETLRTKGKLIKNISVDGIPNIDTPITPNKILESFKIDKSKKIILDEGTLLDAIQKGIDEKRYGYSETTDYIQSDSALSWDGYVVPLDKILVKIPATPPPPRSRRWRIASRKYTQEQYPWLQV